MPGERENRRGSAGGGQGVQDRKLGNEIRDQDRSILIPGIKCQLHGRCRTIPMFEIPNRVCAAVCGWCECCNGIKNRTGRGVLRGGRLEQNHFAFAVSWATISD